MLRAIASPSSPAICAAQGSTNSGLAALLARARYAHTINAVFDAELFASTGRVVPRLLLVVVRDEAVVRACYTHRELGRGLLLARIPGVHVGVVLAHQLAVRGLDQRHVGVGLDVEHAVPLGELRLVRAGARRARRTGAGVAATRSARPTRGRARRRPRATAAGSLILHAAKRIVGGRALLGLALVALAMHPPR